MNTAIAQPLPVPLAMRSLVSELRRSLAGCGRILEIGCGVDSPMKYLAADHHIEGLDVFEPALKEYMAKGFLKRYHLASAMEIDRLFATEPFDAIVALDLIEHFVKPEGFELIRKMEAVAKKRIIVFTPNGFVPQKADSNPWQEHKSGWTVDEFTRQGFDVVGVNGHKALRGEKATLRYRPRLFWGAVSELTHHTFTRNHPEHAYALFCVKELGR